jgi:hypothetical protein
LKYPKSAETYKNRLIAHRTAIILSIEKRRKALGSFLLRYIDEGIDGHGMDSTGVSKPVILGGVFFEIRVIRG